MKFTSAQADTATTAREDGSSLELSSNGTFSWPDSVDEECSNYLSEFSFNDEDTLDGVFLFHPTRYNAVYPDYKHVLVYANEAVDLGPDDETRDLPEKDEE